MIFISGFNRCKTEAALSAFDKPDIIDRIQYLPVKIIKSNYIIIHYADCSHTCRSKVLQSRTTQPACADHQYFSLQQFLLTCFAKFC